MPVFMGLERIDESGELNALVAFPEATRHSFAVVDGAVQCIATPDPHERHMDETAFQTAFGTDFNAVEQLPYNEGGYDIAALCEAQQAQHAKPAMAVNMKAGM